MSRTTHIGSGVILGGTAGLVISKLLGFITWDWIWVLSPLWITAGLLILLGVAVITFTLAIAGTVLLILFTGRRR